MRKLLRSIFAITGAYELNLELVAIETEHHASRERRILNMIR